MSWIDHPLHCECVECVSPEPSYAGTRGEARRLIERFAHRGVALRASGGRLRFFPRESVVGEDLEQLRRLKSDVLVLLSEDDARKHNGERRVRDELEVFDMARSFFGKREEGAA